MLITFEQTGDEGGDNGRKHPGGLGCVEHFLDARAHVACAGERIADVFCKLAVALCGSAGEGRAQEGVVHHVVGADVQCDEISVLRGLFKHRLPLCHDFRLEIGDLEEIFVALIALLEHIADFLRPEAGAAERIERAALHGVRHNGVIGHVHALKAETLGVALVRAVARSDAVAEAEIRIIVLHVFDRGGVHADAHHAEEHDHSQHERQKP